jgi:ankyrin repeat protein
MTPACAQYGQKPLHLAGENDQAEVMKELLARGASIDAPTTVRIADCPGRSAGGLF